MMNILLLYNSTQTYTATVFEHLKSFERYSENSFFFCHHDKYQNFNVDLKKFDCVGIHYSIRLPFDQITESLAQKLSQFKGLKFLFIQDEYDHTKRAWYWIKRLGINLVFTCVPFHNIHIVYPQQQFPEVKFVNNLTGYVPEDIPEIKNLASPSMRNIIVGYRARQLPIKYGKLALEKVQIGKMVMKYCERMKISYDIAWTEKARIYGNAWYKFIASCRAMLGVESGSNVFDWNGDIEDKINNFKKLNPKATEIDIYENVIKPMEHPGLMNQISPKIFEAISLKTVLVLFEGNYSGIINPGTHFIPLKKDGSNLKEVFDYLMDKNFVDDMAERVYQDIIASQKYSYKSFVKMVDKELSSLARKIKKEKNILTVKMEFLENLTTAITTSPIVTQPSISSYYSIKIAFTPLMMKPIRWIWRLLPNIIKKIITYIFLKLKN